jgi:hypothetical protein
MVRPSLLTLDANSFQEVLSYLSGEVRGAKPR